MVFGIVWSSLNTIQSHCNLLSNLYGSLLCLVEIIICKPTHKYEMIGCFLIIVFVILFLLDPQSIRVGETDPNLTASLLTLLVNIPYIIFFKIIKKISTIVDSIFEAVLYQTVMQTFVIIGISILFENNEYDNLSENSVFGWLHPKQFVYVTFVYGLICGVAGSIGGMFIVKYFDLVPMMNLYLFRPIISQTIGIATGIDNVPGPLTLIGMTGIIMSIMLQKYGSVLKEK